MTRLLHTVSWMLAAAAALAAAGCSPDSAPNPSARKVVSSCYALSGDAASAILGSKVEANRLSGDDAPISICTYKDASNTTLALLKIDKRTDKYPDLAKALADDQKSEQALFSTNIKAPKYHPADGFLPGSFYGDITPSYNSLEVELGTVEGGYKILVVINNPKDFATGEKQAADMAKKVSASIQDGTGFATL